MTAPVRARLERDFDRFAADGLPSDLEDYLLDAYRIDVSTELAGYPLKNPWGKASGQLSMNVGQVREDAEAGLGFVVLKTVIAQDADGGQSMKAWAVREARMLAERIVGVESGREGWTITWKGRGWWQTFDEYLDLVRQATAVGRAAGMLIIPSCKYHLPTPAETTWRHEEYAHTTGRLAEAFASCADGPMPLEKDFSPTLAGSDRSTQQAKILEWLGTVPRLIRSNCSTPVRVGLKIFNALFDDAFQHQMLARVLTSPPADRPEFLTYANRLFDPNKTFDGHTGVAYGGPDLSDRNLRVLDTYLTEVRAGRAPAIDIPLCATGDIHSGRMALEYALRGCRAFQIHTFFQLPLDTYTMRPGNKVAKALHHLTFHPTTGLVPWLCHLAHQTGRLETDGTIRLAALVGCELDGAGE